MMTRKSPKPYLFLLAVILVFMSLPSAMSERVRGFAVAALAPVWGILADSKQSLQPSSLNPHDIALQKVQLENRLLHAEVARLQELLQHEFSLSTQLKTVLMGTQQSASTVNPQLKRYHEMLAKRFNFQLQAIPAEVIFRAPSTWNSSIWLNVGKTDNAALGENVIAKNSPVVVGNSIIGVVDFVEEHQCRVRLITDSGLTPCVRAVRGDLHRRMVAEQLSMLINRFAYYHGLFTNQEEKELFLKQMGKLQKKLSLEDSLGTLYLAKGELHGSSQPIWRSRGSLLKGVGFNCDFSDDEGPARDLRTGVPIQENAVPVPLLQVNDLLVTTGMDGVFPAGFYVAEVTKIHLLREGDYSYELEARPTAGDLHELSTVFVIPPVMKEEKNG